MTSFAADVQLLRERAAEHTEWAVTEQLQD
jgi:hypothetical protein